MILLSQMIGMDVIILRFDLSEYFLGCAGLYLQMLLDALLNYWSEITCFNKNSMSNLEYIQESKNLSFV